MVEDSNFYDGLVHTVWVLMTSLLIFSLGMLGNLTTIYIYTRSKKLRQNKVFELILAAFDIYALVIILPTLTVDLLINEATLNLGVPGDVLVSIYIYSIPICGHGYYVTILSNTIFRYVAVFHPFKFNTFAEKWRPIFVIAIISYSVLHPVKNFVFIQFLDIHVSSTLFFADSIALSCFCFVSFSTLFTKITLKLKKSNRVASAGMGMEMSGMGSSSSHVASTHSSSARKTHNIALKNFATTSIIFVVSYVFVFCPTMGYLSHSWLYLYFLNHICQPFIYFAFNSEFREHVRELRVFR